MSVQLVPKHPARSLVLDLVIPGNPLPKERVRITRRGNYRSAKALHNEMSIEWEMKAKVANPARGQLIVDVGFFRGDKRACDIDNLLKQLFDCANGIVWHDDSQVVGLYAQKLYDKQRPRTELRVWKLVEAE